MSFSIWTIQIKIGRNIYFKILIILAQKVEINRADKPFGFIQKFGLNKE